MGLNFESVLNIVGLLRLFCVQKVLAGEKKEKCTLQKSRLNDQGLKLVAFLYQISRAKPYLRAVNIVKSGCMLLSCSSLLALGGEILCGSWSVSGNALWDIQRFAEYADC